MHEELKSGIDVFSDGIGFAVQELTSDEEDSLIGRTVESLSVSLVGDGDRINTLLDFHGHYRVDPFFEATRFVKRMPGVLCINPSHHLANNALELCHSINSTRTKFLADANTESCKEKRFEIVHTAIPGLMSEHIKRDIRIFTKSVKSMAFNWSVSPVPKKLEAANVISRMRVALIDKVRHPLSDVERDAVSARIKEIEQGRFINFQFRRLSTPKPIVMITFSDGSRHNTSCSAPMIFTAQNKGLLPKIKPLKNYTFNPVKRKVDRTYKHGVTRHQLIPRQPIYGDVAI